MIYQVIDLLDGEIVFEGKTKECINYVLNHGPSYDIIPKIVPDATIGVEVFCGLYATWYIVLGTNL